MTGPGGPQLLIDCASLVYRAYHAMPPRDAPDGTDVRAVPGFLGFLTRLIADRRPSRLFVALDADWRPAFRVEALPTYKTHRVAAAADDVDPVAPQMVLVETVLEAVGITASGAEGFEAEDVIATLAARTREPVEVVTGDRDLFALVADPHVTVLYTLRGVTELARVDRAWIEQKYGIPGDRYLDYALLRGDPSDGLPGVPGIGEKTASGLLRKYGSLAGILAATDLSPTVAARLRGAAAYLDAAQRVVAPVRDCPVSGGDGTLPRAPARPERLAELATTLGLESSIARLLGALADREIAGRAEDAGS